MCTPCGVLKVEKWRLRDRAMCFFACRCPPVEEQRKFCSSLPPQMPTSVPRQQHDLWPSSPPHMHGATMGKPRCHKNSSRHMRLERESVESSAKTSTSRLAKKVARDDSICSRYADDDYIVFCFREDGVFHLARDANSKPAGRRRSSSRPVNRKLIYGENAEDTWHEDDGKDIYPISEEDDIISDTKGEGKGSFYLDNELAYDRMRGEICTEERTEGKTESRGSNQSSDGSSTSSFAFPVLRWDWAGSPVHMPKSSQLSGKHRACSSLL